MKKGQITLSIDLVALGMLNQLASERHRGEFVEGLIRDAYQTRRGKRKFAQTIEQIRRLLDGLGGHGS